MGSTRARASFPTSRDDVRGGVRRTKVGVDEEDASELRLGPDFNEANCLSLAEVKIVIRSSGTTTGKRRRRRRRRTRVFEKTLAYVQRFSGNITDVATSAIEIYTSTRGCTISRR